jgi:GNAT superfamily N-acetyltransferase
VTDGPQDSAGPRPPQLPQPQRLGPDDAGELLTLQRAAYASEAQSHDDPRLPPLTETFDEVRSALADSGVVVLGIRESGRLVASVRLRVGADGRIALGRLCVAPDRQGCGLGTTLLRAGECVVDDVTAVDLFTGEYSAGNLRLYRREGYLETHRTPAGNHELVHFTKQLP